MFRRNPSLTEQVKSHLKERIIKAEFEAGRIPSESRLANELGVSRNTVRDAFSRLEIEGVIFRKQGVGTFVNEANLLVKTRLEEIVPYETLIREHGYTPAVALVEVSERGAGPELARRLNLKSGEPILAVQKLFLANGQPVITTWTYLPKKMIRLPYVDDDLQAPVYQFLPEFCRQTLAYYLTDVVPIIAPAWLVERLALRAKPPTALLSFEEIGHNQAHQPIIKAVSYFRDDLLRLRLMRRNTL
jgi:GntR family transcriptional regulator